ncbi:MAG: beta-galactosidase [Phycisphaeraceae bacterium]
MASITYDGQSFIVDGRRVWLVSGAIHYPRTPHQLWRRRIRAAREAGLNCIETYVFWNAHEPEPGQFNFTGDLDLRRFVEIVAEEGMYCLLRPGPYVCAEWDAGGFPAWLTARDDVKLREANPAYLEACARFLGAVMEQVRDLQITVPSHGPVVAGPHNTPGAAAGGYLGGAGGPILMVQVENEWFAHNDEQAQKYLRELVRYLRENGCQVPVNNCNNLWQRVEGTIDTWNAKRHLAQHLRQLTVVQPDAPRLVTEFWPGWFDYWGGPHADHDPPALVEHRLVEILAAAGQYNLYMFHGGTNFGFYGGRSNARRDCFMTTSYDYGAPLMEAGGRGAKYDLCKRVSTFASQFSHVLAHVEPNRPNAAVTPDEPGADVSVIHLPGSQGDVVYLLRPDVTKTRPADVSVLLPDGLTMSVTLGSDAVAWFLLNVNLGGEAQLDFTNLRPWAFVDRQMLVLFGPAGSEGVVSLDGGRLDVQVPTGREPVVDRHEGVTLVILNHEQVDAAYLYEGGLAVGAAGLDDAGQPTARPGWAHQYRINPAGDMQRVATARSRKPAAPRLGKWERASLERVLDGSDEGFEKIDGPASLDALGQRFGYGWYRIGVGQAKSGRMFAPLAGDRLHLFSQGKPQGVLGLGPGAIDEPTSLRLSGDVVVLADNLGRFNVGSHVGERKGLMSHLYKVQPVALGRPRVDAERAPDPFELGGYIHLARQGERPQAEAVTWELKPRGQRPMILDVRDLPVAGVFMVNDAPLEYYHPHASGRLVRRLLEPGVDPVKRGKNELKLALFAPLAEKVDWAKHVKLYEATEAVTGRGQWAFRKWDVPGGDAFEPISAGEAGDGDSVPTWYRCRFDVRDASVPLWFQPRGLTKGQIYLNGHNVGRYLVATADGKAVPPQSDYYLPEPWLKTDAPNELMLFEEHGKSPGKARLVYNALGPYA